MDSGVCTRKRNAFLHLKLWRVDLDRHEVQEGQGVALTGYRAFLYPDQGYNRWSFGGS